jgi:hypothetical protein
MKRIILIILVSLSFAACKKSNVSPSAAIVGEWELRNVSGGDFLGNGPAYVPPVYKPGNGNIYDFTSSNTYKHFTNGKQDEQGTYQVKILGTEPDGTKDSALYLDNDTGGQALNITGSQLSLGSSAADGLVLTYQKISAWPR